MIASTLGVAYYVRLAGSSARPEEHFVPFLILFLLLFITTGIGNGSTFRMVPIIFESRLAGPVLGWISAVAAYGAFIIPRVFGTQIEKGRPEYATGVLERVMREMNRRTDNGARWSVRGLRALLMHKLARKYDWGPFGRDESRASQVTFRLA